jgi:transcriptional regulator with XRE-family HTH domain
MRYESPVKTKLYRNIALKIGENIAYQAYRKQITITELAKKSGLSQGNMSRMVSSGRHCFQLYSLYKIAAVLDVPMKKLLTLD